MDCSLPGSSVHGISQARLLGWVSCHFLLHGIFLTQYSNLSGITGGFFTNEPPGKTYHWSFGEIIVYSSLNTPLWRDCHLHNHDNNNIFYLRSTYHVLSILWGHLFIYLFSILCFYQLPEIGSLSQLPTAKSSELAGPWCKPRELLCRLRALISMGLLPPETLQSFSYA